MANLDSPGTHSISVASPSASVDGSETFVSACMGPLTPASLVPTALDRYMCW